MTDRNDDFTYHIEGDAQVSNLMIRACVAVRAGLLGGFQWVAALKTARDRLIVAQAPMAKPYETQVHRQKNTPSPQYFCRLVIHAEANSVEPAPFR
mgnify:CR=1 FL=1